MSLLLQRYRKGVSPVIAVVLLIALTVAAAAVIWTLTSGILDDASAKELRITSKSSSVSGNHITISLTLDADDAGTLLLLEKVSGTGTINDTAVFTPSTFSKGEAIYSIVVGFDVVPSGAYSFGLTYKFTGADNSVIKFDVSV